MMQGQVSRYEPLEDISEKDCLNSENSEQDLWTDVPSLKPEGWKSAKILCRLWVLYLNVALTISCLVILATSLTMISRSTSGGTRGILKATSSYSPLLDLIEISTAPVQFDGSLFPPDSPSIYRQAPSAEVDEAWRDISMLGAINISAQDVRKLGKNPSKAVTAPHDWNLNDHNYLAYVDVFHQIHCLDTLRKASHYDYYHRDNFGPEGPTHGYWLHLSHCTHMLLQTLMCHADVDLFTYNWVEGQDHPYPDFSATHQCRDFSAIWRWTKEHQLDIQRSREYLKPEGTVSEPEPGYEGAADWAFEVAHDEFSPGYRKPT